MLMGFNENMFMEFDGSLTMLKFQCSKFQMSAPGGELDCAFKLFEELKADGKLDLDEIAACQGTGCGLEPNVVHVKKSVFTMF